MQSDQTLPESSRESPPSTPARLTLAAQPGRALTKAQQTFNRLVGKIEKLRRQLDRETQRLDQELASYVREVHPRRARQATLLKGLVRLLALFLDERRLGVRQREDLGTIIGHQLNTIAGIDDGLADPDLQALFEKVAGASHQEIEAEAFDAMKDEMEEMFESLGVDVDFSDFRPDMTEAELAAKAAQVKEQMQQAAGEKPDTAEARPKTKRQLQKEERARQAEELRNRSIGSMYKQLAKVLHPDLERDPARKQHKSALMQELTTAYRNGDLHTLLRLELEWIRGEQDNLSRLTDEKLAIYNQLLREQASELESELFYLPQHPRYQVLATRVGPFGIPGEIDTEAEAQRLDMVNQSISATVETLRTPRALREVREIIAAYRGR